MLVAQLVLAGLGAVLMLGGTLTATFLAVADARPDLATLSAVGSAPRTRRAVAASYALVVGLVGLTCPIRAPETRRPAASVQPACTDAAGRRPGRAQMRQVGRKRQG
jgi:hypothetical protein